MDYLIRFIQMHESFRKAETEALAKLTGLPFEWIFYSENTPFAIIRFVKPEHGETAAKTLISRSILSAAIYELWGSGKDYPTLHANVRDQSQHVWPQYHLTSFRFELDSFQGSHSQAEQREIIESFSYTAFEGPIRMKGPDNQFVVFEEYDLNAPIPNRIHLGRLVAESGRKAINKYTLKKRKYIATTSMDAELSLVTANMVLAGAGKLAFDPFVGTGSFPLACAHFGSNVFGSDLDGRSIRGSKGRTVQSNFEQYGTSSLYLGGFISDITNTPVRMRGFLDAIVCDPPYGVREGLKVLGSPKPELQGEVILSNGVPAHLAETYVPPKRPYSFVRMLDDILDFAARSLVEGGRLGMWMPVAGAVAGEDEQGEQGVQEESEFGIPSHPALVLVSECTQHFNKWSRRLLTYERLPEAQVSEEELAVYLTSRMMLGNESSANRRGPTADDLNSFRKKYFQGFRDPALPRQHEKLPHTF